MVVLIDDTTEEGGQEYAASRDKLLKILCYAGTQHIQKRRDHQAIPTQIAIGRNDIYGHIERMQGAVPGLHVFPVPQTIAWPRHIFDGPPVLPVHYKSDPRPHTRANDSGRKPF